MSEFARTLHWCRIHDYPALRYEDGSVQCMYDLIVEVPGERHDLTDEIERPERVSPVDKLPPDTLANMEGR